MYELCIYVRDTSLCQRIARMFHHTQTLRMGKKRRESHVRQGPNTPITGCPLFGIEIRIFLLTVFASSLQFVMLRTCAPRAQTWSSLVRGPEMPRPPESRVSSSSVLGRLRIPVARLIDRVLAAICPFLSSRTFPSLCSCFIHHCQACLLRILSNVRGQVGRRF